MAVITTGNHPKLLWPGIAALWGLSYDETNREYTDLFDVKTSTQNYEEDVQVTGFGMMPVKPEGMGVQYDDHLQGYVSRYVHVAYGLGFIVTKEELDDNLYLKRATERTEALGFSCRQTEETIGANVYNRAQTGGYVGGDGQTLLSASHPDSNGGLQSNVLAVAANLSEVALEDICVQIMRAKNSRGLQIKLQPKTLIIPPDLVFDAHRILNSVLQNNTDFNAVNALRAMRSIPSVAANHYLTSETAWFVRTNAPRGMIWYDRVKAEFTKDNDFNTENALAKCYRRHSAGWTDFRGVYGSEGV